MDPVEIPQGLENDGPPDHSEYIPPAAPVESNTEDNRLGDSTEVNSTPVQNTQEGTGNTGGHPAWNGLLEKVPTPFHDEIKPFLAEFDKNFEKAQSRYAPYKDFAERNVSPEAINQSLQLAQLINANPKLVYDQLGSRFGFSSGQDQEEVEPLEPEYNEDEDENFANPLEDPRLKPYLEQQQRMAEFLSQQQQAEQQRQLDQSIQQEWQSIEKSHGSPIPQDIKAEMIKRAIWIGDQTGKEPSLKDGYDDYNAFVTKVRGQKANNTAPQVFGGNGGLPSTPNGITADMSDEERISYIAERARILNSN